MTESGVEYADYNFTPHPPPCSMGCLYCFWTTKLWRKRAGLIRDRWSFAKRLEEAERLARKSVKNKTWYVAMISFTVDPYPEEETKARNTSKIIKRLVSPVRIGKRKEMPSVFVMVLTKNPNRALELDGDLFIESKRVALGTTLTTLRTLENWEPLAETPIDRLRGLERAQAEGIPTFISVEPVIPGLTELEYLLKVASNYANFIVVGKLNYVSQLAGRLIKKYGIMVPFHQPWVWYSVYCIARKTLTSLKFKEIEPTLPSMDNRFFRVESERITSAVLNTFLQRGHTFLIKKELFREAYKYVKNNNMTSLTTCDWNKVRKIEVRLEKVRKRLLEKPVLTIKDVEKVFR